MKAILKADWNIFGYRKAIILKKGKEVIIFLDKQLDSTNAYFCKWDSGNGYIPLEYLEITDWSKEIDWEQRKYEVAKAFAEAKIANLGWQNSDEIIEAADIFIKKLQNKED